MTGETTRRGWTIAVLATGTVGLLLQARAHWAYVTDDAFISIQYASRFLHGHGLTWTSDAPPVEGYSNLLWVLSLALLGATGLDLLLAARVLGITCTWLLLALVAWRARHQPFVAAIGIGALLASGTVATWSVAGLEGPMVALLVVAATHAAVSVLDGGTSPWQAGLALAALTLARVDGFLFAPVVAGYVAIRNPKAGVQILALPVAVFLAHTGFRWLYYGDAIPNVAHIKARLSVARIDHGVRYVAFALKWGSPLVLGACILGAWARGPRIALLLANGAVWAAYVAFVGGDIFPARRHTEVCVAVLAAALVEALVRRRARWASALAVAAVGGFLGIQLADPENERADADWSRQALALGTALERAFGHLDPLMAVRAAGALPYGSGFRCIDMLGLNDREIALHPVERDDSEMIGHDHFNAAIVLRREPDLIVNGNGAFVQRGAMMEDLLAQPEFVSGYDRIPFRIPKNDRAWVYVRRDSSRVGIMVDADRVAIPAWFFADEDHLVRADTRGQPAISIASGEHVSLSLPLAAGRWEGSADATAAARVTIDGQEVPVDLASPTVVTVDVVAVESVSLSGVELIQLP